MSSIPENQSPKFMMDALAAVYKGDPCDIKVVKENLTKYFEALNYQSFEYSFHLERLGKIESTACLYLAYCVTKAASNKFKINPKFSAGVVMGADVRRLEPAQTELIKVLQKETEPDFKHLIAMTTEKERVFVIQNLLDEIKNTFSTTEKEKFVRLLTFHFEKFQIKDPFDRSILSEDIAVEMFKIYRNSERCQFLASENDGFAVLREAVQGISTEEIRFLTVRLWSEELSIEICELMEILNLSETHRKEIACEIGTGGQEEVRALAKNMNKFNLSEASRLELGKFVAEKAPQKVAYFIHSLNLSVSDRVAIGQTVFRTLHPCLWGRAPLNMGVFGFNIDQRTAIAKMHVLTEPISTVRALNEYELDHPERIFFYALSSAPEKAAEIIKAYKTSPNKLPQGLENLEKEVQLSHNQAASEWWTALKTIPIKEGEVKEITPYLKEIFKLENPSLRYLLTGAIVQFGIPPSAPVKEGRTHLVNLVLAPLLAQAGLKEADVKQIWDVFKGSEYREPSVAKLERVIKGLNSLLECNELSNVDKGTLLKDIFENHKTTSIDSALQMIDAIISTDNAKMLKGLPEQAKKEIDEKDVKSLNATPKRPMNLEGILKEIFKRSIGDDLAENLAAKYKDTIGSSRNPHALLVYGANLNTLPPSVKEFALNNLREFTKAVLNGTYKTMRYKADLGSHLATAFAASPSLSGEWQKGAWQTIESIYKEAEDLQKKASHKQADTKLAAAAAEPHFDVVGELYKRVCQNNHLSPKDYPCFASCLHPGKSTDANSLKNALAQCKQMQTKAKAAVDAARGSIKEINPTTLPFHQRKLEEALITFLMAPTAQKKVQIIEKMLPTLRTICSEDFVRDMEWVRDNLQTEGKEKSAQENTKYDQYTVEDTDDWQDMLLSGTEVAGSCQRIGGDPYHNKCLGAYMRDGKNRAIIIRDPVSKKIVARCIMRLLLDKNTKKPVLFQERLYHNPGIPQRVLDAINLMFVKRADKLKIPLFKSMEEKDTAKSGQTVKHGDLESLNSSAPYEYVDAGGIGVTEGTKSFTIQAKDIVQIL